jgi:hypothetical protein
MAIYINNDIVLFLNKTLKLSINRHTKLPDR